MNMLECFFSDKYAGRSDVFEGLSIWKYEEYRNLQGTYPVISLSFAEIKENNYKDCYRNLLYSTLCKVPKMSLEKVEIIP